MCAIVDANVAHEVFGSNPSEAGDEFFGWINKETGRLVVGGKLLEELEASSPGFRDWASQAVSSGRMRLLNESEVSARTERIEHEGRHQSNDAHVLALAQLSGKPIVRDMRIAVDHILGMLAAGDTVQLILKEYPFLESEDIQACLVFAHRSVAGEQVHERMPLGATR